MRRGHIRLIPAALLVVGIGLNLGTAQHLTFLGLFVAAPLIAAALDTPRVTLVIAVASVVSSVPPGLLVTERILQVATVVTGAALALVVNAVVVREHRRVASALGVAEVVQRAVVPDPPARVGGLRVAARYRPAQHGALVGGERTTLPCWPSPILPSTADDAAVRSWHGREQFVAVAVRVPDIDAAPAAETVDPTVPPGARRRRSSTTSNVASSVRKA